MRSSPRQAPDLRAEQLARKAAALEMKLNPEAVKARRERAKRDGQRVEARREASGNACLAGRELDTADVLASKAYLDAVAARLRESGVPGQPGPAARAGADRPDPGTRPAGPDPARACARASPPGPRLAPPSGPARRPAKTAPARRSGGPAPVPALINLSSPPGRSSAFRRARPGRRLGPAGRRRDPGGRRRRGRPPRHPLVPHPDRPDGTALAHGCARGPRPRLLDDLEPQPPPAQPPAATTQAPRQPSSPSSCAA